MKKIMFVVPSFCVGGIEKQLLQQLWHFDKSRYQFHLAILFDYRDRPSYHRELPPEVAHTQFDFSGYFDFRSLKKLWRLLKTERPDLVVTSTFPANTLLCLLRLFFSYRILPREHNTYVDKRWWHWRIDRLLAYFTPQIIAVSKTVAEYSARRAGIPIAKFKVVNNGIDTESLKQYRAAHPESGALVRRELGLAAGEKILLNVARLKRQKNHALLFRAFSEFQKKFPAYKLVVLGDGQERIRLEKLIQELGLSQSVFLLGFRTDVWNFYCAADFFVLSSDREGFPNVVLEAMTFGLPVVTTPVGGVEELMKNGQNGFVVNGESELRAALCRVAAFSTAERDMMSAACAKTAAQFDIRKITKEYEVLFDALA